MRFLNTQRAPRHAAPYVSLATLVEVMSCAVSFCAVSSQPSLVGLVLLDARVVVVLVTPLVRIHLARCFDRRLCVFLTNALDHTKEAFRFRYSSWITYTDVPGVHCRVLL